MKRFAIMIALVRVARPAFCEVWCRSGPGTPLDHPCVADKSRFDRAFAEHGQQMAGWRKIPDVSSIGYGMSRRGFFPEIQVWVKDTSKIPSVRAKIPASVEGIAVAVLPPIEGTFGRPTDPTIKCPEQGRAYIQAMKEGIQTWPEIRGVVGLGPSKCDSNCCYFHRIGVGVQVPFVESVRAKIPRELYGIPIDVVPFQWPARE